ncbi:MAG: adenylate/guanylate cyclase domain-containing protein [Acidobacteria bacterium]|nr:adenylate/guanylate cyclase domain-containing protein [Acidobacteriota bacterium]
MSAARANVQPVPQLEIAHVLFMDIVAYSTMPMDRQQSVVDTLQEAVQSAIEFCEVDKSHELIRLPTGDGMALVFFGRPEAPVLCALKLAELLRGQTEVKLRMGIHSGPVYRRADINANTNVAGGGINIAQRVMDCGDSGHILVSKAVGDTLGEVSQWADTLHDLGEVTVKHGVRVHVFNLYTADAGNAEIPAKVSAARTVVLQPQTTPKRQSLVIRKKLGSFMGAAVLLATLYPLGVRVLHRNAAHSLEFRH